MGQEGPQRIRFHLALPATIVARYYSGQARRLIVEATDGRRLELPFHLLQRFIRHDGIHGLFELSHDGNGRCLSIRSIATGNGRSV